MARRLAARGFSVLIVEKRRFPRYKVCGCCLNQRSMALLHEEGVVSGLDACNAPGLNAVMLHAGKHVARLALPGGRAVSRSHLDVLLVQQAADAGARVLFGTTAASEGACNAGVRCVRLRSATADVEARARIVIAADGLGGKFFSQATRESPRIARGGYIGLGALSHDSGGLESGLVHMHCGRDGYLGAVRVEEGALAVAAAVDPARLREAGSPAAWARSLVGASGADIPIAWEHLDWHGTPVLTRRLRCLSSDRLVALGDAGGYVEPFTGEGMAWALESAARLDLHLADYGLERWNAAALAWDGVWRAHMRRRRLWCRALSTALRYPRLTAGAVRLLARAPHLSRPVVTSLNSLPRR